jgi:NAD(P)-dependent dehydrogenase (short-subunit alcohol dehydrogenase family)
VGEPVAAHDVVVADVVTPYDGPVAVVTGAGRGIGRAIAEGLAADGMAVVCAARSKDELDDVVATIENAGGRGLAVPTDVRDPDGISALVRTTVDTFGGLDNAVLNAGALGLGPLATLSLEEWHEALDVNLTGTFLCAQACVQPMITRGGGRIIVMGSGAGRRTTSPLGAYSAAKAGVAMLVRALAIELREHSIAVNEIIPGPVRTRMASELGIGIERSETSPVAPAGIASDWMKEPSDLVPLVRFLMSQPTYGPSGQVFSLLGRDL